jgi:glutamyl-tRNA synthetase
MSKNVRVRFAPSPTGPLHIGGVRTALFNYLFAKKHRGTFVLRIEDTDQNRYVEGAEAYIIEALHWCGIPFDEGPGKEAKYGPYKQSERQHLYKKYVDALLAKEKAYYAFDTEDELDTHRKIHEEKGKTFIYNWHNRLKLKNSISLPKEEVKKRIAQGESYAVRFKSPQDETLLLNDRIRGHIKIDTNTLDDKVLFKSDGMPTYHLANIVDDHLMEITHVIRGEEWLPSLALHVLLYRAFGWEAPEFAHLPLILKPTGNGKLSKRDGDRLGFPVFPLAWNDPNTGNRSLGYREAGYFPEAVINFLALLGWNPGTAQEIFSLEELIAAFDIERIHKSGARFDPEKIKWFNHHYLQTKSDEALVSACIAAMPSALEASPNQHSHRKQYDRVYVAKVVSLIKERATFINDLWELGNYFFIAPLSYDNAIVAKQWKPKTGGLMMDLTLVLNEIEDFSSAVIETKVKQWAADKGLSFGQLMPLLRLALVGAMKGPHLFDIAALLGKEETIIRIKNAVEVLAKKH